MVAAMELVEKIHGEIDYNVDLIMRKGLFNANADVAVYAKKLNEAGFVKCKNVVDLKNAESENELIEYALRYKEKYPFLKFITEEVFFDICKKYNLVYADVGSYIGNVPIKNAKEIIDYDTITVDDWRPIKYNVRIYNSSEGSVIVTLTEEEYTKHIDISRLPIGLNGVISAAETLEGVMFPDRKRWRYAESLGFELAPVCQFDVELNGEKRGLFIAADMSLFDFGKEEHHEKKGFGFFKKPKTITIVNPDPIVFRFVKGGILIISKWGLEANDEQLVIPELN